MSLFGTKKTHVGDYPPVLMLPPRSGHFNAGAVQYQAQQGATMKVRGDHMAELASQGWEVVQSESTRPKVPVLAPSPEALKATREARQRESFLAIPPGDPLVRVLPPLAGPQRSLSVEGRPYLGMDPRPQDVPAFDARLLCANGWLFLCTLGSAADRPARSARGDRRTEAGRDLVFDGTTWRNVATGERA